MRIVFDKNPDNNEWGYVLSTNRNGKPFEDSGYVNMVEVKNNLAEISTNRGRSYYVPLGELTDEQRTALESIAREIREKRIRSTSDKNANNLK